MCVMLVLMQWILYHVCVLYYVQLIGLESRQSQEMSEHLKSQERELEQLHHQWDKDLERLRTKTKSELENRVCDYIHTC